MDNFLTLENRHTGEVLRMQRVRNADGQATLILKGSLPPHKSGPPLHLHFKEREEGQVKAGTLGYQLGDQKQIVPTGGAAVFPAQAVHSWWNAGEDLLEFNGHVTPVVDLDRYLQAIFAVLNAGEDGRPSLFYLAHILDRHKETQAAMVPPPAVQRILFPVVLALGRILGKYNGDNWPGAPASCPGAPTANT